MFDKPKAMRSAERFLSQGKLRDAIAEYRKVVDHDPRDVVTLNMLGDLHCKNADSRAAYNCYRSVADHYSRQGFAQKAIAIYNKMARLQPNSPEIAQKLAELYKTKGSLKEAKSHYSTLAEHYNKQGRRIEALEIWTEIAVLDPNNTEVYLTIGDAYLQESRLEEASEAFANAGARLSVHSRHAEALEAFTKAFAINPKHPTATDGFINAKFALGTPHEAVAHIEKLLAEDPQNRELLSSLIDVSIRAGDATAAEKQLLRLVEVDPTNYLKCLDLADVYFVQNDVESAVRILTIASEHMLVGGQAGELQYRLEMIEEREPNRLDVVRLLARFCSWQKDDEYLRTTLVRLNEIAAREGAIDDERYALSQLVISMPQEAAYAERLKAINLELGIQEEEFSNSFFNKRFVRDEAESEEPGAAPVYGEVEAEIIEQSKDNGVAAVVVGDASETTVETQPLSKNGRKKGKRSKKSNAEPAAEIVPVEANDVSTNGDLQKEIDSIKFYIENGYTDLASKAINELKGTYGERAEIDELTKTLHTEAMAEEMRPAPPTTNGSSGTFSVFNFDDLRSELGLEESDGSDSGDFETLYQTAVAYQEMGLMEQAIKEFQDAAALVSVNDGTRRFFNCANLLGHCFMEMGRPNLAVKWHLRSLEMIDLNDEERQGVWYELGLSYEADGDMSNAAKYFEQVYSENIDFRDIGERIKDLAVHA